ncbi:MAG: MFS transporter [Meiothermus sp.]
MRRSASMTFILVVFLIDTMGLGLIIPVLPKLIEQLSGSLSAGSLYNGVFIAIYSAMQFVFAPLLGALSDRYGRRPVLLISLLATALDYLIAALTPNLWLLLVTRIIAGVLASTFSVANAYIADVSAPEERAKNFGLVGAIFGMGFILGPALGGLLGNAGLRLPFYFAAGLALLNALYGYFVLPESLKPENRSPKRPSLTNPLASLSVLGKIPMVRGLSMSIVLLNLAFQFLYTIWVLYTAYRFGWTTWQTGLSLMLVGLVSVVSQGYLVGKIVPRIGERRAVLVGFWVGMLTYLCYGMATQGWMMYAAILLGLISGVGQPALQAIVSRSTSEREQGTVQGGIAALASLTGIVGPVLGGFIFAQFAKEGVAPWLVGMPFFLGTVLYAIALANTLVTFRRIPEEGSGAKQVT